MSKKDLKVCRKLDRCLDDFRKALDIYTQLYPSVKDTLDAYFDDIYDTAHEVIARLDIGTCSDTDCTEIFETEDLDEDGYCESCREE